MIKSIALFIISSGLAMGAALPLAAFAAGGSPSSLFIPSIGLVADIQNVGVNALGEMAVPLLANTVGWYAGGTMPGQAGSAVIDAHVYLAFKNLKKANVGDNIYVTTKNGTPLRFVISKIVSYAYEQVPLTDLFALNDGGEYLNLITCAGKWLPRQGTYDHRLVVYAELASS